MSASVQVGSGTPVPGTPRGMARRASVEVVLGSGPIAMALASELAASGPALLASPEQTRGPYLWRRARLDTGEGVLAALANARRVYLVLDETIPSGALALLERVEVSEVAVVNRWGRPYPAIFDAKPDWSRLELGPCWGGTEPLVAAWSKAIANGEHVWTADPGPVPVLPMPDAVAAVRAVVSLEGARWRLSGPPAHLPELADALAAFHDRPLRATRVPILGLAARRAGVPGARIREWLSVPFSIGETTGWDPPASVGRTGWLSLVAGRRPQR